jgi:hypothetical protein
LGGGATNRELIYALNKPNDSQAPFQYWAWDDGHYTNSTGFSAIGSGMLEPDYAPDNTHVMFSALEGNRTMRLGTTSDSGDPMFLTDSYPQLVPIRCVKN